MALTSGVTIYSLFIISLMGGGVFICVSAAVLYTLHRESDKITPWKL
jgi:hypothetical protein